MKKLVEKLVHVSEQTSNLLFSKQAGSVRLVSGAKRDSKMLHPQSPLVFQSGYRKPTFLPSFNKRGFSSGGPFNEKNRKEAYEALGSLTGLAVGAAIWQFNKEKKLEKEKQKTELGMGITKDIEKVKTKLKFFINEWDASVRSDIFLMSESNVPKTLDISNTPALILKSDNSVEVIVNNEGQIAKINVSEPSDLKMFQDFIKSNKLKNKLFLSLNHEVMRWITKKGGHTLPPLCDLPFIKDKVDLKKINEYEEAFSYSMRMVSRYDISLVPEVLQIEADYQNELFRKASTDILVNKSNENVKKLRQCFSEIYNVLNIVGIATSANTIETNHRTKEQQLLVEKLADTTLKTDDIRKAVHDFRKESLIELKSKKEEFEKSHPDADVLVRTQVYKPK